MKATFRMSERTMNRYNLRNPRGVMYDYTTFRKEIHIYYAETINDENGAVTVNNLWAYIPYHTPATATRRGRYESLHRDDVDAISSWFMALEESRAWETVDEDWEFGLYSYRDTHFTCPKRVKHSVHF